MAIPSNKGFHQFYGLTNSLARSRGGRPRDAQGFFPSYRRHPAKKKALE
jgi:hypothetical protein